MTQPHRGKAATKASRDDWQTPGTFLAGLRERWVFELDAACSARDPYALESESRSNAVAPYGLTGGPLADALACDWTCKNGVATWRHDDAPRSGRVSAVWCNPPFGRRGTLARQFIARAAQQARDVCGPAGLDVVVLAPATPGVRWMHDHVLGGARPADEVWCVDGRLAFVHPDTGQPVQGNPVGSMLLVWRAGWRMPGPPMLGSLGRDGRPVGGWFNEAPLAPEGE